MYVGTQHFGTSRTEMEFLVRHGVNHFDASVADMEVDTLRRYRERRRRTVWSWRWST